MQHEVGDQRRSEAGTRANTGENPPIRDSTLAKWNPPCDELVRSRIDHGLPRTEQESDRNKCVERASDIRGYQRCEAGENPPPEDSKREHTAGAKTIGQSSSRSLKEGIAGQHRTDDFPKLHLGQPISVDDGPARDGKIDAIQI